MILTAIAIVLLTMISGIMSLLGSLTVPFEFITDAIVMGIGYSYHASVILFILLGADFAIAVTAFGLAVATFDYWFWMFGFAKNLVKKVPILGKVFQ